MTSAMYFFIESEGIRLPDGTVFGAGITHEYDVLKGENRPDMFTAYQYIGKQRVSVFNGVNLNYRQMRTWVHDEVRYYEAHGMKLWMADRSEWDKAKVKTLVTLDW